MLGLGPESTAVETELPGKRRRKMNLNSNPSPDTFTNVV